MVKEWDVLPDFEPGHITLPSIPKFQYQGRLEDELSGRLSPQEAFFLLELMLTVRAVEEQIAELRDGAFKPTPDFQFIGATHLSVGQEAVAVGGISAVRPDDYITSTHRGHGHSLSKVAFAIRRMKRQDLLAFLAAPDDGASDEDLRERAMQHHLFRTWAELFGKEEGYCRGRGGSMHIAEFALGHLGANAIVGGSIGIGTGAAMASQWLGTDKAVLCIFGDGAVTEGIFHESCCLSTMGHLKQGPPVIYLVENNQYSMTGQTRGETTSLDYLAQQAAAYNSKALNAEVVNGMDVLAVRDAVLRTVEKCRAGQGPVLLECMTYRFYGHSLSDSRTRYRSRTEEESWRGLDPIKRYGEQLVRARLATEQSIEDMRQQIVERVRQAAVAAAKATDPDPARIADGLFAETTSDDIGPEWKTINFVRQPRKATRDSEGRILFRHAIAEALMEEMIRDRRVLLFGEDVADYGGAFQVTAGLFEIFGRERVFNTCMAEAAIVGAATGMAMVGMRPVCEIMYIDFLLLAADQLFNQAAKSRYMFGAKATVPIVVRTTVGGGKGYAGQHSQSLEAVCAHFPGLKVVAPSTAYDAKGLLKASIRDDNPVVFIEHQLLYTDRGVVPEDDYIVPLGQAAVRREGKDLTIIGYSKMVQVAMGAAELLESRDGVSAEVVDIRTLCPLDLDTLVKSAEKTGRVIALSQAPRTGCFAEHIAYELQERLFDKLKAPIRIAAAYDVPPPMAQSLERENIPDAEKVARIAAQILSQ